MKYLRTPNEVLNIEMAEALFIKRMTRQQAREWVYSKTSAENAIFLSETDTLPKEERYPYQVIARTPSSTYVLFTGVEEECELFLENLIQATEDVTVKAVKTTRARKS